jgi:hypothetical protein
MIKIPKRKKIKLNLNGFKNDQYIYYCFSTNDKKNYISEYERWKSREINHKYHIIFDDKWVFSSLFSKYIEVPNVFAFIKKGEPFNITGSEIKQLCIDDIVKLLYINSRLVIKPIIGSEGSNFHIIKCFKEKELSSSKSSQNHNFFIDNNLVKEKELKQYLISLDQFLVTEYVKQHEYINKIYPHTTNSIRMITIVSPNNGEIILTNAIHRIGRNSSYPVDNFSKGGLTVEIDLETGILGRAASKYSHNNQSLIFMDHHPDSGAQISGIEIPDWKQTTTKIRKVASLFPYLKFIAWDVVITETGLSVLEINASSGLNLFQVFGGLRNGNLADFFKHHGIIK